MAASHAASLRAPWHPLNSAEKSAQEFLECVPWAASVCLTTVREELAGSCGFTANAAEVERAAALLFTLVQSSLGWMREFGYGQQAERSLLGLFWVQRLAIEAVAAVCPGARRKAKLLQLQAAVSEPLTVCVGDLKRTPLPDLRDVLDPFGELEPHKIPTIAWNTKGSGCGAICADSTGTRRASFSRLCKSCRDSGTAPARRKGHGHAKELRRRITVQSDMGRRPACSGVAKNVLGLREAILDRSRQQVLLRSLPGESSQPPARLTRTFLG